MELLGSMPEGEWLSSLNGMYSTEEADFMAQFLGSYPSFSDHAQEPIPFLSRGSGNASLFRGSGNGYHYLIDSSRSSSLTIDTHMEAEKNTSSYLVDQGDFLADQETRENGGKSCFLDKFSQDIKKNPSVQASELREEEATKVLGSKKRSRNVETSKRNVRSRKNQKLVTQSGKNEEETNAGANTRQSSNSCCSEDDSNSSQEHETGVFPSVSSKDQPRALNSDEKSKTKRGAATDPQSLYARKRRERINERLRTLQSLVPNGTKVDISTMLEEAVHYVKLLQLQIKLLSSDDLWMYAPIAYNGMNIGLDLMILTAPKRS